MNDTWYDDTLINRFEQKEHLTNNQKCAVLIVGGGLAGLCLLYKLKKNNVDAILIEENHVCLLYTSPSPRDRTRSRMPSSA